MRFTRNVAAITMDLNDVESIVAKTFGGADNVVVNDLSGTDVTNVVADLTAVGGGDDAQPDNVIANATNGDDVVNVIGAGPNVAGQRPLRRGLGVRRHRGQRPADGQRAGRRRRGRRHRAGRRPRRCSRSTAATATTCCSAVTGTTPSSAARATTCCSAGRASTRSTAGRATTSSSSVSADAVTSATVVGSDWLTAHARTVKGKTVLKVGGKKHKLPRAELARSLAGVTSA